MKGRTMMTALKRCAWLFACAAVVLAGCEGEDSPDTEGLDSYFDEHPYVSDPRFEHDSIISLSPSSANITYVGQSVTFTASGGERHYTWDVAFSDRGTITSPRHSQAIYTASQIRENSVIVYDENGHTAIAQINAGSGAALVLTVDPSELANNGDKSLLTVSGGTPPYTWSVSSVALGNVDSATGTSVIYTRNLPGDNAVTVTDSAGNSASKVIQQP